MKEYLKMPNSIVLPNGVDMTRFIQMEQSYAKNALQIKNNTDKFFWRWQDYMFEENILDTIKDISLSNYFKKEVEHKYNLVFYT